MKITKKNILTVVLAAAFLSVILAGCASREHMSPDYGVKNREFFAKQWVYEEASEEPVQGLDTEEAAIIQATYRKNTGGKAAPPKDTGSKVLIVEESKKK